LTPTIKIAVNKEAQKSSTIKNTSGNAGDINAATKTTRMDHCDPYPSLCFFEAA